MAYTINTNITSLQAQEYLRVTTDFQSKTINRVTSGLRIISSGDDAAGLAIANGFRSDRAVLTQGVRNAFDGLSTLQTIDGGINNISQLLDRARTLAAQSASGTFTGDRTILDSEFQSLLVEIDRQAQTIGLDQGGAFAQNFSVFIGGGRANAGVTSISNGSVAVDLSQSTVDSNSLGMAGVQATGVAGTDIGSGSAATSVQQIVANANNVAVYSIDLTPSGTDHVQSSFLNTLAADTGGSYHYLFTSFTTPLRQIAQEATGYYLLSYRSEHPAGESGYQRIKVGVRAPKLVVRAQKGYRYGG